MGRRNAKTGRRPAPQRPHHHCGAWPDGLRRREQPTAVRTRAGVLAAGLGGRRGSVLPGDPATAPGTGRARRPGSPDGQDVLRSKRSLTGRISGPVAGLTARRKMATPGRTPPGQPSPDPRRELGSRGVTADIEARRLPSKGVWPGCSCHGTVSDSHRIAPVRRGVTSKRADWRADDVQVHTGEISRRPPQSMMRPARLRTRLDGNPAPHGATTAVSSARHNAIAVTLNRVCAGHEPSNRHD